VRSKSWNSAQPPGARLLIISCQHVYGLTPPKKRDEKDILADLTDEPGPVLDANHELAAEDEVERLVVDPFALDIVNVEPNIGTGVLRLYRADVVADDLESSLCEFAMSCCADM